MGHHRLLSHLLYLGDLGHPQVRAVPRHPSHGTQVISPFHPRLYPGCWACYPPRPRRTLLSPLTLRHPLPRRHLAGTGVAGRNSSRCASSVGPLCAAHRWISSRLCRLWRLCRRVRSSSEPLLLTRHPRLNWDRFVLVRLHPCPTHHLHPSAAASATTSDDHCPPPDYPACHLDQCYGEH